MNETVKFLDAKEAAIELRISPSTLAKMRVYGTGPHFRKIGRRVLYSKSDLQDWLDSRRYSSTSEYEDA